MKRLACLIAVGLIYSSTYAQENITLEDIFKKGTFSSENVYGLRSMNDGKNYTSISYRDQAIEMYSYKNGKKVKDIVAAGSLDIKISNYQFSADEKKLLLSTETEKIYRHSSKSVYYVYDIKSKKLERLSEGKQMYATYSPSGDQVAFVRDNNLFMKDLKSGKEFQITDDGKYNSIINGATDWVYEEEFAFDQAFFWSADGKKIAFYKFDESDVREFSMDMFQGDLYPSQYQFKYPKAGEDNAKVSIHVYDVEGESTVDIALADEGEDFYIPRIKWSANPEILTIQKMNRHQNGLTLYSYNSSSNELKVVLSEEDKAYIDITDDLTFLDNKTDFIWTSERSGYNHIYLYNLDGKLLKTLTSGNYDVSSYYGLNQKAGRIYYASAEVSPMERHIYSVKVDGKGKTKLTKNAGWNSASFSTGMKYFINTHSRISKPSTYTLHEADGSLIRTLEDNKALNETLASYPLAEPEFLSITTERGDALNAYMMKPADFDPKKEYPVFMYVYGGPGSQTVRDSWGGGRYMWFQMLTQAGYIVVSVDNRGTGARGSEFKKVTYQQLGLYETEDQISSAKYLGALPYVDKGRIGIFGWSYGGYMSSLCLSKGAEIFKAAIAVAPVTNWRYYDTIYTERYMRTPQENASGYDDNSPINHVEKMKGAYLLVHGSADDNVHYQNTMEMIRAMVEANKQFDLFIYPDKNHGIYGGNTSFHLYTKMTNFIKENL